MDQYPAPSTYTATDKSTQHLRTIILSTPPPHNNTTYDDGNYKLRSVNFCLNDDSTQVFITLDRKLSTIRWLTISLFDHFLPLLTSFLSIAGNSLFVPLKPGVTPGVFSIPVEFVGIFP
ncbi:hypothetical protein GCM10010909_03810 [Acidocella aquatica]|uniref:Uncharacterized protein n=1 Tax=Acidocella aquatica TaxID=1922313 RepID=A0ABQ6A671_9PROT|nr:hypothetical protein GCM10010909_03810 [Acidocella aquatica]